MSRNGVEKLKSAICHLIKDAASYQAVEGDEPLVVLITLAAKMIAEIKDEATAKVMAELVSEQFPRCVKELRQGNGLWQFAFFPDEKDQLH